MTNIVFKNIVRFLAFILLQVLLFNNIHVFSYITPFVYIFPLLLLPVNTPRWALLLIGFLYGIIMDFFSNTGGIHAAASVLICFIRPWIENTVVIKEDLPKGTQPGIKTFGFRWFFIYSLLLITSHHIAFYFLEIFSFYKFLNTLGYALLNTFFTLCFVLIFEYFFYRKN